MSIDIGWIILAAYTVGFFIAWVVSFRLLAADDVMGVHTEESTPGVVGTILGCGQSMALLIAMLWPLAAAILLVYRHAVAPALKKRDAR